MYTSGMAATLYYFEHCIRCLYAHLYTSRVRPWHIAGEFWYAIYLHPGTSANVPSGLSLVTK